jgi:hypothetical protein
VWTVLASIHIGKDVTSICKAGIPTGTILLTLTKMTIDRMNLQLHVDSKTMVNGGGYILHILTMAPLVQVYVLI